MLPREFVPRRYSPSGWDLVLVMLVSALIGAALSAGVRQPVPCGCGCPSCKCPTPQKAVARG